MRRFFAAAIVSILSASTSLAQQAAPMPGMDMKGMESMMPNASDNAGTKASKEAMMKMMMSMSITYTGDADKDFVAGMIPHHSGAIAMAKVELEFGKDPMLRELAKSIIAAQDKEIAEMQGWQKRKN